MVISDADQAEGSIIAAYVKAGVLFVLTPSTDGTTVTVAMNGGTNTPVVADQTPDQAEAAGFESQAAPALLFGN